MTILWFITWNKNPHYSNKNAAFNWSASAVLCPQTSSFLLFTFKACNISLISIFKSPPDTYNLRWIHSTFQLTARHSSRKSYFILHNSIYKIMMSLLYWNKGLAQMDLIIVMMETCLILWVLGAARAAQLFASALHCRIVDFADCLNVWSYPAHIFVRK